jgi:hypothetical protein
MAIKKPNTQLQDNPAIMDLVLPALSSYNPFQYILSIYVA